ncbi:MAG: dipeptidase [Candidatus Eremiobacteraeota bacterium]|nr:dipeptidase [Candidatus Eremiobacteraeota bacterium]
MSYQAYLDSHKDRFLDELIEFVRIPSVSTDSRYKADIRKAAELVSDHCRRSGLEPRILETPGHPAVVARGPVVEGKPHLLIYGHYDVQPAEDVQLWQSGPFEPEVRDHRLYGRGASDNKGQILAHLLALEALHKNGGLPVNVTVLVEGEEEIGSPSLPALLKEHRSEFEVDLALVSDTSTAVKGYPTVHYSLRGIVICEVQLRVAARDIHSGVFGGTTENAVRALTRMCARLHDEQLRVTVPGFYDDVLEAEPWELDNLERLPFDEAAYLEWIGASEPIGEAGFSTNQRRWFRPTLECNGIYGGYQGEGSKTIVPAMAGAKFSARLVANQKPEHVLACLKSWFEANCPAGCELTFRSGDQGPPYLLSRQGEGEKYLALAGQAISASFGQEPLFCRHGGAIPIVSGFETILGVKTLLMGLGSPDDAIHSHNEKFELANFYAGMKMSAEFLSGLAALS